MDPVVVDEDEKLTLFYSRRQELLKELTDVDNQIKALEHKVSIKQQIHAATRQTMISTGDLEVDSIREVLEKALHDQTGLREAQKVVDAALRPITAQVDESEEDQQKRWRHRNIFVRELINFSSELIIDPHGNYLLQKALSYLKNNGSRAPEKDEIDYNFGASSPVSEVMGLLETLGTSIGDIASNMHGTRAVQRLVDCLASIEEFELFCDLVANDLVTLIKDLNGNHAVSRLLVSPLFMSLGDNAEDPERREKGQTVRKDVYHIVASNCVEICRNRQGCCIIQRCLQWAPEPFRTEIINAALNCSLKLVQDPFGNYVVQYILDLQQNLLLHNPQQAEQLNYTNRIIRQLLHNISPLSCNKFSSNVIEKCFKTASPDVRQLLIDEITDPHALPRLVTDSFGNYVVQTAIVTASDDAQFIQLRDAILPLQHLLKNSPYGIKIESKLMKRHRESTRSSQRDKPKGAPKAPRGNARDGTQRGGANSPPQQQQQMMVMPIVSLPGVPPPVSPTQQQQHQYYPQQMVPQQQQQAHHRHHHHNPIPVAGPVYDRSVQQRSHQQDMSMVSAASPMPQHHHHHHHHHQQHHGSAMQMAPLGGSWANPGQPVYTAHQQNLVYAQGNRGPLQSPYGTSY